jgi:type IV secretion system protein VirD4
MGEKFTIHYKTPYMYREYQNATNWVFKAGVYSLIAALIFGIFSFPIAYVLKYGFSQTALDWTSLYFQKLSERPDNFLVYYTQWLLKVGGYILERKPAPFRLLVPSFPLAIFVGGTLYGVLINPFEFAYRRYGESRWAEPKEITKMKFYNGQATVIGIHNKKDLLRLPDCQNSFIIGSPGTGKTSGVIIPTILKCDKYCMLVHDPKNDIYDLTSGHRAKLGPVFDVNWAAVDDPEEGVYYPKWNPISKKFMPPAGSGRDGFLAGIAYYVIPDGPTGADPYWTKTARSALEGFMQYIHGKYEQAVANDYFLKRLYAEEFDEEDYKTLETYYQNMKGKGVRDALNNVKTRNINIDNYLPVGSWKGIPAYWQGRDVSLPMVMDWVTERHMVAARTVSAMKKNGDPRAYKLDPIEEFMTEIIEESIFFGYSWGCRTELQQLKMVPKNQRSSILSTMLAAMSIFKNSIIRERTSASDFSHDDMRGIKDPETGQWKPVTVYLSTNFGDAQTVAPLTRIFMDFSAGGMMACGPNEGGMGPYEIWYVLDDITMMPAFDSFGDTSGVNFSKKIGFIFSVNDLSQISGLYGGDMLEILISNTQLKLIMKLNNEQTIGRIHRWSDASTRVVRSHSGSEYMGSVVDPFSERASYRFQVFWVTTPDLLGSMEDGKIIAIHQRFLGRPLFLDQARYFKDKEMLALSQIPPAPHIPKGYMEKRDELEFKPLGDFLDVLDDETKGVLGLLDPIEHNLTSKPLLVDKRERPDDKKVYKGFEMAADVSDFDDDFGGEEKRLDEEFEEFKADWQDYEDMDYASSNYAPSQTNYVPSQDYEAFYDGSIDAGFDVPYDENAYYNDGDYQEGYVSDKIIDNIPTSDFSAQSPSAIRKAPKPIDVSEEDLKDGDWWLDDEQFSLHEDGEEKADENLGDKEVQPSYEYDEKESFDDLDSFDEDFEAGDIDTDFDDSFEDVEEEISDDEALFDELDEFDEEDEGDEEDEDFFNDAPSFDEFEEDYKK